MLLFTSVFLNIYIYFTCFLSNQTGNNGKFLLRGLTNVFDRVCIWDMEFSFFGALSKS